MIDRLISGTATILFFACVQELAAQTVTVPDEDTVPAVSTSIADFTIANDEPDASIDLSTHFEISNVTGQIVRLTLNAQINYEGTLFSNIDIELFDENTPYNRPLTVANFLKYVTDGDYDSTYIHRSVPGFVVQGGGYPLPFESPHIDRDPPIQNEPGISNTRGTIAMAKVGPPTGQPPTEETINSATSEWFFNIGDNSENLNSQNGGFTVFGRAIGSSMSLVDSINASPRTISDVPYFLNQMDQAILFYIVEAAVIPVYPDIEDTPSVISFSVSNDNESLVTITVEGSNLVISPQGSQTGSAEVTVTASDSHGNETTDTFTVTVTPPQTNHDRWLKLYFPSQDDRNNPAVSGDDVDLTGDGITNLLAYAFDLDPYARHENVLPEPAINGSDRLSLEFVRDTRATDLTYMVEAGGSPGTMTMIVQSLEGAVPTGSGFVSETAGTTTRTVTVQDVTTTSTAQARFIRLKVTREN